MYGLIEIALVHEMTQFFRSTQNFAHKCAMYKHSQLVNFLYLRTKWTAYANKLSHFEDMD